MKQPTPQQLHQWIEIDKLSQAELASRLGISQATISRLCTKHGVAATGKPGPRLGSHPAPRQPTKSMTAPVVREPIKHSTVPDSRIIDTSDSQL